MIETPKHVYHASSAQGLQRIVPSPGIHGTWVFAVGDRALAAAFLSTLGGDLTCAVGRDPATGCPYICERFAGAFDERYAGAAGSIYVLDGVRFRSGVTPWEEEFVCDGVVRPRAEIPVSDAARHIEELAAAGRMTIARYPKRIAGIPEDDLDLVERAVEWATRSGSDALKAFAEYHPGLLDRIREALAASAG